MKTFRDLNFQDRTDRIGGKRAVEKLGNDFEVSVLFGGDGIYSNGIDTFELAIIYKGEIVNGIGECDVYAYISAEEVNDIMLKLQCLTESEREYFNAEYERVMEWKEDFKKIMEKMGKKD